MVQVKQDIQTRADVELLINAFYDTVKQDDVIGYIFNDVMKVDWEEHLPVMYEFWGMMLLGDGQYRGNPLMKHVMLNQKTPLKHEHFERWLEIWCATLDKLFEGEVAQRAKARATHMRSVMTNAILERGI